MTVFFEINGTRYESATEGSVRAIEERLRMSMQGHEVSLPVRQSNGQVTDLHVSPGAVATYAVWADSEPSGSQN